jgi:hypothetical protein
VFTNCFNLPIHLDFFGIQRASTQGHGESQVTRKVVPHCL